MEELISKLVIVAIIGLALCCIMVGLYIYAKVLEIKEHNENISLAKKAQEQCDLEMKLLKDKDKREQEEHRLNLKSLRGYR